LARRIADEKALETAVTAWAETRNSDPVKIDWQFTTADARIKLRHLYPERKQS
jgi:hypothetical protein